METKVKSKSVLSKSVWMVGLLSVIGITIAVAQTRNAGQSGVSESELKSLQFMLDEEKLAGDVYAQLDSTWQIPSFEKIQSAEMRHQEILRSLLTQFGQPASTPLAAGQFRLQEFNDLYRQLIAQGSQSKEQALRVGALIEELDIADLQTRIAQTQNESIKMAYEKLMCGSRNHLRAFTNQLSTPYEPKHLTQAAYVQILASSQERCGQGMGGGMGQGMGHGG